MKPLLFIVLTIIQFNISAGEISKVFGTGVFGTIWGNTFNDVKKEFPDGKVEKYGVMTQFVVKDGRSVFGLKRSDKALIRFSFNSEKKLNAVVVYFKAESYGNLLGRLVESFGQYSQSTPYFKWEKDNDITVSLSSFNRDAMFTIEYSGLHKPVNTKVQLGF